jgi:hypothetical protein
VKYVFAIVGVICLLASAGACATAKSSIGEAIGVVIFLAGIVSTATAALLEEIRLLNRTLYKLLSQHDGIPTLRK